MINAALLSVLFLASYVSAQNPALEPQELCLLMTNGTIIADQSDCSLYYQCINGAPVSYSCANGYLFNKEIGACTIPTSSTCPTINNYCENMNGIAFVADPYSCQGYYYCDGTSAIGQHGNCPSNENFDPNTASCEYSSTYSCLGADSGSNTDPSNNDICALIPSNTYFGVSTDCSQWALCQSGQYSTGNCPGTSKFNTANGDCDYTSGVVCQQLGYDQNGNPIVNPDPVPPSTNGNCSNAGQYISDGMTCTGFYWCNPVTNIYNWGNCDNNMFFDAKSQLCLPRQSVLCTVGNVCASTSGTPYKWVNDPTNCQKYYYCSNNEQSAESYYCPNGEYFDEVYQACTYNQPTYAACVGAPVPSTSGTTLPNPGMVSSTPTSTGSAVTPGTGVVTTTGSPATEDITTVTTDSTTSSSESTTPASTTVSPGVDG